MNKIEYRKWHREFTERQLKERQERIESLINGKIPDDYPPCTFRGKVEWTLKKLDELKSRAENADEESRLEHQRMMKIYDVKLAQKAED